MPTNKHASCRYRILDHLFQRPRRWTLLELQEAVSLELQEAFGVKSKVSTRTLQADMNVMRSLPPRGFDAPILCEKGGYSYEDRKFSINNLPFSQTDLAALHDAFVLLKQFKGLPQVQPLLSTLQKFQYWARHPFDPIIQFETNELVQGTEWLEILYQAIVDRQPLQIQYQSFTQAEAFELVLHPYHLREYRNRWFVFGQHDQLGEIYNLALDRIKAVKPATLPYRHDSTFDPIVYFKDIIGVTRYKDALPIDLQFRTSVLLSKYLISKPMHPSQRIVEETDQWVTFSMYVIPNFELQSELLRFGSGLEVVAPATYVQTIKAALDRPF